MKILFRNVFLSLLLGLLGGAAFAQDSQPQEFPAPMQMPQPLSAVPSIADIRQEIAQEIQQEIEQSFADKYEARLDALGKERFALDWFMYMVSAFGFAIVVLGVAATWIVGKSQRDIRTDLSDQIQVRLEKLIEDETKEGQSLETLILRAKKSAGELEKIAEKLKGFEALAETVEDGEGFDPLVDYLAIDREIDRREEETKKMIRGDDTVELSATTRDKEFRQKAAGVFQRLLEVVAEERSDVSPTRDKGFRQKAAVVFQRLLGVVDKDRRDVSPSSQKSHRITSNTCFNAAANASKMEMDFVALELMRHAAELSQGNPVYAARLLRQRMKMNDISLTDAEKELGKILKDTYPFDTHLVVSEAFNIAVQSSQPIRIAGIIERSAPLKIKETSYYKLNVGRLYLMGPNEPKDNEQAVESISDAPEAQAKDGKSNNWEKGRNYISAGLKTLNEELPTLRWHSHGWEEVAQILGDFPDLLQENDGQLRKMLLPKRGVQAFVEKFGIHMLNSLNRHGFFEEYIEG